MNWNFAHKFAVILVYTVAKTSEDDNHSPSLPWLTKNYQAGEERTFDDVYPINWDIILPRSDDVVVKDDVPDQQQTRPWETSGTFYLFFNLLFIEDVESDDIIVKHDVPESQQTKPWENIGNFSTFEINLLY